MFDKVSKRFCSLSEFAEKQTFFQSVDLPRMVLLAKYIVALTTSPENVQQETEYFLVNVRNVVKESVFFSKKNISFKNFLWKLRKQLG